MARCVNCWLLSEGRGRKGAHADFDAFRVNLRLRFAGGRLLSGMTCTEAQRCAAVTSARIQSRVGVYFALALDFASHHRVRAWTLVTVVAGGLQQDS